ncbi:MAG: YfaZ family outer membrane protein [Pseudomonadota bacterium]
MLNRIRRAGFAAAACTLCAATVSSGAIAEELNLSINDDAARLTYAWDVTDNDLKLDAGWLHHQDRGDVLNVGLHLEGAASSGASPVIGGLGGKVFYIDPDGVSFDAIVLGIGGYLRYTLPQYNRINLYAHAYFAPDVLAFGDGDTYQEFEARIGYNVLREADVFLGVRYANIEFDPFGEVTMDNGLHLGIQLRF